MIFYMCCSVTRVILSDKSVDAINLAPMLFRDLNGIDCKGCVATQVDLLILLET